MKSLTLFMIFIFNISLFAQVDCDLRLRASNINFSWDGSDQVVTGNLSLRRGVRNNDCSSFVVGFSKGSAGNYDREMVRNTNYVKYNLYKNSSTNVTLKEIPDRTNFDENIFIFFTNNNQRRINTTFEGRYSVPNDGRPILAKANYRDTITATATGLFVSTLSDTNNFRARVVIPAEIDISLVNGGSFDFNSTSYTMNFNNLTQGETGSVDLKVRSNAGYSVELTSANGGQLKHGTANSYINYGLKVNGATMSFAGAGSPLNIGTASGVTPNDGVNFDLEFTIGNPQQKLAGQYQDTITVTAMSID